MLILGAALLAVVSINRWLDVSGINTSAEVYRLATEQSPDDLLVWENLFDQRSWVKARLERKDCPEIFVTGSSTVGAFRSEWFKGRRFLNGWLSAPTVEDFEALTSVMLRSGCIPSHIVLGVDHWLLNARFNDRRWISIASDYVVYQQQYGHRVLSALNAPIQYWDLFKERLNFVSTMESVTRLISMLGRGQLPSHPRLTHATPEQFCVTISSEYYIRSADGHFTTCPVFENSRDKTEILARSYVSSNGHQIREWAAVDSERLERLRVLLSLLHAKGSQIILVAEPFHPATYELLMGDERIRRNFREMDNDLTELARSLSGQFLNFRRPGTIGCGPEEFEDPHHAKPSCLANAAVFILSATGGPKQPGADL